MKSLRRAAGRHPPKPSGSATGCSPGKRLTARLAVRHLATFRCQARAHEASASLRDAMSPTKSEKEKGAGEINPRRLKRSGEPLNWSVGERGDRIHSSLMRANQFGEEACFFRLNHVVVAAVCSPADESGGHLSTRHLHRHLRLPGKLRAGDRPTSQFRPPCFPT